MTWYQQLTATMAAYNLPTVYTNAAGFVVKQQYFKMEKSRAFSPLGELRITTPSDDMKVSKQVDGIAANVTHCNDSALVVLASEGFAGTLTVIHDSLGTHACDVPDLLKSIQEGMVRMYVQPVLEQMLEDNAATLPEGEDISRVLPAQGGFDLNEMLSARYLFC